MPLNLEAVGKSSKPSEQSWGSKDALLYALGVGAGVTDPTGFELEFTTENSKDIKQRVLPTFPVVASNSVGAFANIGSFNPAMLVHGEQSVELHGSIPVEGAGSTVSTIEGIYDKGSGAVVAVKAETTDAKTKKPLWTTRMSAFIRGEGGFGGDRGPSNKIAMPTAKPDHTVTYETRKDQALLYRLSGDRNPLHSDPSFAALGGFDRPILHGLCTWGFTGRALLHSLCDSDPDRFVSMSSRFSKPVMPGDTLTVRIWKAGSGEAHFETSVGETVVIDSGVCRYKP